MAERALAIRVQAVFFFIVGVIFATLFVWALVQGIISHLGAGTFTLAYYFAAWLAGIGALALYTQAKILFHYARISR